MNRYPAPDEVIESLGRTIVEALRSAVLGARDDLETYRAAMPDFALRQTSSGLAHWIYDRMWRRACDVLDGVGGVSLVNSGSTREIHVGFNFRIRLKRHSLTGAICNYPTASADRFITQEPDLLTLLGITTLNLTVGYEWDGLTQSMGNPVISLRDGSYDEVIWLAELPTVISAGGGVVTPISSVSDSPEVPVVVVSSPRSRKSGESTES